MDSVRARLTLAATRSLLASELEWIRTKCGKPRRRINAKARLSAKQLRGTHWPRMSEPDENQLIPEADFALWVRPVDILAAVASLNFHSIAREVHRALCSGELQSAATSMRVENASRHRFRIPASLWKTWPAQDDLHFWAVGDLIREIGNPVAKIEAFGVRFDPLEIGRLFPNTSPKPVRRKGGRPAGTSGEPIARLTKHLLSLPATKLAKFKVEALASELIDEYRKLDLNPPHEDNAKRDASGILRALREADET